MIDLRKSKGVMTLMGIAEYWCHQCFSLRLHVNDGSPERCQNCGSGNIVVDDPESTELDALRVEARKVKALPLLSDCIASNDISGLLWNERRKKGEELAKVLREGDRVSMRYAEWSPIRAGRVEEKDEVGFKVGGLWFGWHELDSIQEP